MRNTINTLSLLLVNNKTDLTGKKKKLDNTTEMPLTCYILSHVLSDTRIVGAVCMFTMVFVSQKGQQGPNCTSVWKTV